MRDGKRVVVASLCAAMLLTAAGAAFRSLEDDSNVSGVRGPAREIGEFPLEIDSWRGRALPVDERIIAATDTDAYVSRYYRSTESGAEVGLYVGCGVRVRDLVPHRPTVCYPGAGWTLSSERAYTLEGNGVEKTECRIYRFERGALDDRTITVLNYYIIDGTTYPDVEYLRSRGWGRGNIGYVAQVQITSGEHSVADADFGVSGFASVAASVIRKAVSEAAAVTAQGAPIK